MGNRVTLALRKTADGGWQVVHEHSSAPADFDTGEVQLRRLASD
jgi:ketosteroid isomerase-like protein